MQPTGQRASWLFIVRIWSEPADGLPEYRGRVSDVASGAFIAFRDWTDLTSFLADQLDQRSPIDEETPS